MLNFTADTVVLYRDVPASTLQHDPDIPVLRTEGERAEAKQAEAKEEALKSICVHLCPRALHDSPAFAYSRNESYCLGTLIPNLQPNTQDKLQDIYAPSYLHNRYVGGLVGHKSTVQCDTRDKQLISTRWTYVKRYLRCLG